MDFTKLIQMAKQNRETAKDEGKYYKAKLAPPKKETKESRRLSENIQKFLQKREQEEKEKEIAQKKKVASLLEMRDEKSKNKIRKMLKVTKSANKSVLDDTQTAVNIIGPEQADQDDYGYVSTEANAFYQKYIEKVKDVKEDKGFAPSRPQNLKDLSGTKDRVKAAITREREDKMNGQRKINIMLTSSKVSSSRSSKSLYDPEAERREEEKQRKEEERKKAKNRKPPLEVMNFRELIKLAEKKQHEPIQILQKEVRKEPERLLTLKEKRELEEQKRAKEARERRDREKKEGRPIPSSTSGASSSKPNAPIPVKTIKLNDNNRSRPDEKSAFKIPSKSSITVSSKTNTHTSSKSAVTSNNTNIKSLGTTKPHLNGVTKELPSKSQYNGTTRDFPPKTSNNGATRDFPSKSQLNGSSKQLPPRDKPTTNKIREPQRPKFPSSAMRRGPSNSTKTAYKRRILDDDEEEYDSEMDDFIDDGDDVQDYSSVIKDIFGYDKSKYRDFDDDDDSAMESNFAQVQREEYLSKKIGIQEDLEDMRLEALEKEHKRKMMKRAKISSY